MKPLAVLTVGIFLLGSLIGVLAGLSASPVVASLLPLLFTLLTAGGGVWMASGTKEPSEGDRNRQMLILGLVLVTFVVGFIPGLWSGIAAKLNPDKVWFLKDRRQPAYGEISFGDVRMLVVAISLDERMEEGGLGLAKRRQILGQIFNAIAERSKSGNTNVITPQDKESLDAIWKLPGFFVRPATGPFWEDPGNIMATANNVEKKTTTQ